jgi:hypothetical protein
LIVHFLREGGRVANFVADEVCQLNSERQLGRRHQGTM